MKRLSEVPFTPTDLNEEHLYQLRRNSITRLKVNPYSRSLVGKIANLCHCLVFNTSLLALDLTGCQIGVEGARSIARLLSLQNSMDLSSGGKIRALMLGDNQLGEEGCSTIARALRNNNNLEFLYLDDNQIGAIGLEILADALRTNSSLQRLHLKHNSFQLKPLIR